MSVYATSPIKHKRGTQKPKRDRATQHEMQERGAALVRIVKRIQPCTVRQAYYQATVEGVVEKTENGYSKVQRLLVDLRNDGLIDYQWIVDNTRFQRKPRSFSDPSAAIDDVARFYRKDLWRDAEAYVEIWLEKDALSGVIFPITAKFDVPLMTARGYASVSFLWGAAEYIDTLEVPAHIYHLGDFDPSGVDAGKKIESTLRKFAPNAEIHFERLAVNREQIAAWNLPSRPTKKTDSRAKGFDSDVSVELDAIHPETLREMVASAIERHLPAEQYDVLKVAEASERQWLKMWAANARGAAA